ncbi:hypothetical protein [Cellulomonas sp. KRMCY2]|uniref:hypothetical protein n=1 Tax=Cellulomonas sp. KRMCY2 TaxID=1304865 RepID=UPI0012DCB09E|nr:hypothetical protein [Cellulomonas sp. KRMCY2]
MTTWTEPAVLPWRALAVAADAADEPDLAMRLWRPLAVPGDPAHEAELGPQQRSAGPSGPPTTP